MTQPVLKEAATGDLDGLLAEAPAADEAIEKTEEAIEKGVSEEAKDAEVVFLDAEGKEISEEEYDKLKKSGADVKSVAKGGDEGAPKSGGSPGNPVVDNTSDTGLVSLDEGGVPAGFRKEERVLKQLEDGKIVEKFAEFLINDETKEEIFLGFITKEETPAAPEATSEADGVEYSDAELKLFEAMNVLVKNVSDIKESVEKQNERIDAVAKTAHEAKETADETVVMTAADDLDESLATLNGKKPILKADGSTEEDGKEDIFKGLLPDIEGNAA